MRHSGTVDGEGEVAPAVNGDHVCLRQPAYDSRHPEVAVPVTLGDKVGARNDCIISRPGMIRSTEKPR